MTTKPNYHQLLDGTPIPPEGIEGWVSDTCCQPGPGMVNSHRRTVISCTPTNDHVFIDSNGCIWSYFTPKPKPVLHVPDEFWARVGTACVGVALSGLHGAVLYYGSIPSFVSHYWNDTAGLGLVADVITPNHGIKILDPSRPQDSWTPNPFWEGKAGE